ncbi:hypothetical protein BDZ97DRAFT_1761508 [Flammula alnicola]|nr:hypothetical protein BDZ97DRAFT_1761508 [Flammula alnicola]
MICGTPGCLRRNCGCFSLSDNDRGGRHRGRLEDIESKTEAKGEDEPGGAYTSDTSIRRQGLGVWALQIEDAARWREIGWNVLCNISCPRGSEPFEKEVDALNMKPLKILWVDSVLRVGGAYTRGDLEGYGRDGHPHLGHPPHKHAATFFGILSLPDALPVHISPTVLDNAQIPTGPLSRDEKLFFRYLREVEHASAADKSGVIDFVVYLLGLLGYDSDAEGDHTIFKYKGIAFEMAKNRVIAEADICMTDDRSLCFSYKLKQKTRLSADPVPGLFAVAIAVFSILNLSRSHTGLPPIRSKNIAGITIAGSPHVLPHTRQHKPYYPVATGSFPDQTVVQRSSNLATTHWV